MFNILLSFILLAEYLFAKWDVITEKSKHNYLMERFEVAYILSHSEAQTLAGRQVRREPRIPAQ